MNDRIRKSRSRLNVNGAIVYAACLAWLFFGIYQIFDKTRLIVVMNAFVFGTIISLVYIYYDYVKHIIKDDAAWDRARQFTISTCVCWLGIAVVILASVLRHSGSEYNISSTNFLDYLFRYLVIISATMQVFAPGYGNGLFYGTDRKTLIWGSVWGLGISLFLVAMQAENFLDW